ncbi:MAG: hypothetical protein E7186_05425 [Erysipelotrichaceae bacterium]|nr:hypothetical protein [Erysipelotrichaceae bacterium]
MKTILTVIRKQENIDKFADSCADAFIMADRMFSSSYDQNDLKECIKAAHRLNRKLYVRCDRLYDQNELEALEGFLVNISEWGADGIIYSDIGVFSLLEKLSISCKGIYAPETLLTNYRDIADLKDDGVEGCVISKDIPLDDVIEIAENCPEYCYLRIHGPILIAYSHRRYIASYLQEDREHAEGYYLQEETRDTRLPLVEKKEGSWLYGTVLQSLNVIKMLEEKPFAGFIVDNVFDDDEETLRILDLYEKVIKGTLDGRTALNQLDGSREYTAIEDVRKTWLDKEQE